MPPVLTKNGDALELSLSGCRGSEFEDAKEKIKEVPGRRFDFDRKLWIVPAEPATADRILKTIRPTCDEDLVAWVRASQTQDEESLTTPLPDDAELLIPWATQRMPWQPEVVNDEPFNGLLPYQRAAVDAMATSGRLLNGADMGLGKTIMAISALAEWQLRHPDVPDGPKLVVCPNSVKGSWARELRRWLGEETRLVILEGSAKQRQQQLIDAVRVNAWVITNWESLRIKKEKITLKNGGKKTVTVMKEPLFEQTKWLCCIGDEIHRAKNRKAQQTQGLWRVQAPVMFGLTGTPLANSPDEIWAPLRWLWPEEYNSNGTAAKPKTAYWSFYNDFVEFWEDHFGRKVVTGVKNPDALRFVLKDKLIRQTAALLGLKGRKRIFYEVPMNPGQRKLYEKAEKEMWLEVQRAADEGDESAKQFIQAAADGAPASTLYRIPNGASRLVRLQQIIENPAILGGDDDSAIMDDFQEKFEDSRPHQWVVFTKYKASCDLLAERLRKKFKVEVGIYNGDVSAADRTELENAFQRGEIDVMIGTIDAMREGITLTNSQFVYFLSRAFVPAWNEQAESRCDRLGQQELVLVYIPQAENSVATDKVQPINEIKQRIVRTVIDQVEIEEEFV